MAADPKHISATAKVSAYYRQFSDIPFAAEVATLIGADDTVAQIIRDHGLEPEKLTFYAPMFEARYKSITQLIRLANPRGGLARGRGAGSRAARRQADRYGYGRGSRWSTWRWARWRRR